MLNEIVTQTHALVANTEQSFGTLAAAHPNVEVIVNAGGDLAAVGSTWKLYDVTPAGAALVWQGKLVMPLDVPQRLTPPGGIQAGATLELRGVNVKATAAITTSLVGYDPECCDGSLIVNELEGDVTGPSNDNRVVNISGDAETNAVGPIGAYAWTWETRPLSTFPGNVITFDAGLATGVSPVAAGQIGAGWAFKSTDAPLGLVSGGSGINGGRYSTILGTGANTAGVLSYTNAGSHKWFAGDTSHTIAALTPLNTATAGDLAFSFFFYSTKSSLYMGIDASPSVNSAAVCLSPNRLLAQATSLQGPGTHNIALVGSNSDAGSTFLEVVLGTDPQATVADATAVFSKPDLRTQGKYTFGATAAAAAALPSVTQCTGDPNGVVTGANASLCMRSDGVDGSRLYVCKGGTVWTAVAGV